jgi:hypothetical protein
MSGRIYPESINPVEFPDILTDVWLWYLAAARTRNKSMGLETIKYTELESYFRLMRIDPEPWHIEIILSLDKAWIDAQKKE